MMGRIRPASLGRIGTAILALAIAVGGSALMIRASGSTEPATEPNVSETIATTALAWAGLQPGWNELPPPPVLHEGPVTVWADHELLLWGGNEGDGARHFADGYAFDPATSTWRMIAHSPLSVRSWPAAVWTGTELLIWGGSDGSWPGESQLADGAAYDPSTDSWRSIAAAPFANAPIASVWTGTEMLVWGSYRGDASGPGAAYDPVADTWRTLPDSPVPINDGNAVWTGNEMVVFGADLGAGNSSTTDFAVGAAYDPATDVWRELPGSDFSPQASDVAWDGTRIVAADYGNIVAALEPQSDRWSPLPSLPVNQCEGYPQLVTIGTVVFSAFCGELVSLPAGSERWHVIEGRGPTGSFGEDPVFGDLLAADQALLLIGDYYSHSQANRLRAYSPPSDPAGGPTAEDAQDVAAAFGALRSHYPYDREHVPATVQSEISKFLSEEGSRAWEGRGGLRAFWAYYPGFEIRSVEGPIGDELRFEVTVAFSLLSSNEMYEEVLVVAPGVGLDGQPHDLVVVDAQVAA